METRTKIILLLIILTTGVILGRLLRPAPPSPLPAEASAEAGQSPLFETQENSGGNVTVSVTPLSLKAGLPASFDVALETHSVDLAFDVEKVATLTDDQGSSYIPHWDGSPPGGHHRSGALRFTPDLSKARHLTLTFRDIAGVADRTFTWEVNGP